MAIFTETIQLKNEVSPTAKKAADDFNVLSKALASTQNALTRANALGDTKKIDKLTQQSTAYKSALDALAPAELGAAEGSAGLMAELTAVAGVLASVAAAAGVVVVGFGALVAAGAAFALEAVRDRQKAETFFEAMAQGAEGGGKAINDMTDQLSLDLGLANDQIEGMAKQFLAIGVTDLPTLKKAITATASAVALMGDAGGAAFQTLYEKIDLAGDGMLKLSDKQLLKIAETGANVADIAAEMGLEVNVLKTQLNAGTVNAKAFGAALQDALIKKGAGPLENMANTLQNLGKILKENVGKLFEDIEVGPFLSQMKSLLGILDEGQPSAQALKAGLTGFFNNVFAAATKVVPYIKHFLLDLVIYGLKAYIALKPIGKAISDWANSAEGMSTLSAAFDALVTVAKVLGGIIAFVSVVVVAFAATLLGIQVAIVGVGYAILSFVSEAGAALSEWIGSAYTLASDFVAGLINGITDGAAGVVNSVKGLADSATSAFTEALGIASPSKVMMELGGHVASGAAVGIEDGIPDVHGSATSLATAAIAPMGEASGAASGGSTSTTANTFYITISGAGQDVMTLSREAMASAWEASALAAGV